MGAKNYNKDAYLYLDVTWISFVSEVQPDPGCNTPWGEWSTCWVVNDEACGIGMQARVRQCGSEERVEERPCLKCGKSKMEKQNGKKIKILKLTCMSEITMIFT